MVRQKLPRIGKLTEFQKTWEQFLLKSEVVTDLPLKNYVLTHLTRSCTCVLNVNKNHHRSHSRGLAFSIHFFQITGQVIFMAKEEMITGNEQIQPQK